MADSSLAPLSAFKFGIIFLKMKPIVRDRPSHPNLAAVDWLRLEARQPLSFIVGPLGKNSTCQQE